MNHSADGEPHSAGPHSPRTGTGSAGSAGSANSTDTTVTPICKEVAQYKNFIYVCRVCYEKHGEEVPVVVALVDLLALVNLDQVIALVLGVGVPISFRVWPPPLHMVGWGWGVGAVLSCQGTTAPTTGVST